MRVIDGRSWHGRLFVWARDVLGMGPSAVDGFIYVGTVLVAILFISCAAAIWIVLNAGTLLFGVYAEPAWRADSGFVVLKLPGRIPLVAIATPVLLGYALWRTWLTDGVLVAAAPFVLTIFLGFALFGMFIAINKLRRRLQPWSVE